MTIYIIRVQTIKYVLINLKTNIDFFLFAILHRHINLYPDLGSFCLAWCNMCWIIPEATPQSVHTYP